MDHVDPTRERFAAFRALESDGPIHMLNLVRLRERAVYADGREVSGAEAYAAYGRESRAVFERVGGRQVWIGVPEFMLIGPEAEAWDIAFIAEYPTADAFVEMLRDPVYREAVVHRTAGVADSRLLRLRPGTPGPGFGEAG